MNSTNTKWDRIDTLGKLFIGIFGILVTLHLHYGQSKISENVAEINRNHLKSVLIAQLSKHNLKEQVMSYLILNEIDSTFAERSLKAIRVCGENLEFQAELIKAISKKKIQEDINKELKQPRNEDIISYLASIANTNVLFEKLFKLVKSGKVAVGKFEDFVFTENSKHYLIIIDENKTYGIYHYDNKEYTNVSTNESFQHLPSEYDRKSQVWIQIY
ncbi:MAG: hypothetical protein GF353_05790 [Candidatus Lokiarchaeota archaeon]|nr:hypothetical protein [Candidatus Lokiarchaeota archaeon]